MVGNIIVSVIDLFNYSRFSDAACMNEFKRDNVKSTGYIYAAIDLEFRYIPGPMICTSGLPSPAFSVFT